MHTTPNNQPPVFGFIMIGGSLTGAQIRDIRIANELAARGFAVHVWWALDYPHDSGLNPAIKQHSLFPAFRYLKQSARPLFHLIGKFTNRFVSDASRNASIQHRPAALAGIMTNLLRVIVEGIESDPAPLERFIKQAAAARITHFLPMLAMLAPYARHAQQHIPTHPKYLVTFQGYELYIQYAMQAGIEQDVYKVLRTVAAQSDYPAVAVSPDYKQRVIEDIKVPEQAIVPIPPGVIAEPSTTRKQGLARYRQVWTKMDPDLPLITFFGRRDTEKGIDLLMYAGKILQQRGVKISLAVVGPTLFGNHYSHVIYQMYKELRLENFHFNDTKVPDDVRDALFACSHAIVYPSIHREPFGMVPVEAAAYGTPTIVPNYGGVQDTIQVDNLQSGLLFDAFDSGDLADKIQRLVDDLDLWQRLSNDGPKIAQHYAVQNITDRLLDHMSLPTRP